MSELQVRDLVIWTENDGVRLTGIVVKTGSVSKGPVYWIKQSSKDVGVKRLCGNAYFFGNGTTRDWRSVEKVTTLSEEKFEETLKWFRDKGLDYMI